MVNCTAVNIFVMHMCWGALYRASSILAEMWSAVQGFQDGESELMQILSCHGIPSDDDY